MRDVEIHRETVELFKILKFEGLAGSGGEAKGLIADGQVSVKGVVENRKCRKMLSGDLIEFKGDTLRLLYSDN